MNRVLAWTVSLAAALSFMAASGTAQTSTYKGEITDEHLNCVQTPVKAVRGRHRPDSMRSLLGAFDSG